MNLLEFSIVTVEKLNGITNKTFASHFIEAKIFCYHKYQNGFVTSNSHGTSFFDNVIEFWDNPDSYYTPKDKSGNIIKDIAKIPEDDYEYNFIRIIKLNKEENNER